MKKIVMSFIFIFLMLFVVTGCGVGYNSSPESVAVEMVKRLSKDNYGNMKELFYHDEDTYFDEKVFQKLVEEKKLNIKDNKKIEVNEIGSEITGEDGNVHVKVKIDIDNNDVFNLETVNIKNKWYVYDKGFYAGAMTFIVPEGSKVYLNGNKLDSSLSGKQKTKVTLVHPKNSYREISTSDNLMYGYKVAKVLKGQYDITVEGEKTIKDVVYSSKNSSIKSTNYKYQTFDDSSDGIVYIFGSELPKCSSTKEQKESIKKYFEGFYKELVNAFNKHTTFPNMESYFEKDSEDYKQTRSSFDKSSYLYTKSNPYKSSYYSYYYSDFKYNSVDINEVYYCNDNSILVALTPSFAATLHSSYGTSKTNQTPEPLVKLKKVSDSYVMIEKYNLFW